MLEAYIRPAYQKVLVNPCAEVIFQNFPRLSANSISLFAGVFGIICAIAISQNYVYTALICMAISGYLDTLDGTVARMHNSNLPHGAVLDIITDRVVEFAIIAGLFAVDPTIRGGICIFMLGSILLCITSFLMVGMFTENTSQKGFHYSVGLMERAEAFIFFALMILFPNYFNYLGYVFIVLVLYTTVLRLYEFMSQP